MASTFPGKTIKELDFTTEPPPHAPVGRADGKPDNPDEWRAPPIATNNVEPFYRGPTTHFMAQMVTMQMGRCGDFELKHQECLEAYGAHPASVPCSLYRDDLYECMYRSKQIARLNAMRDERQRQYKAGLRTKMDYYDIHKSYKERYL